jgi:NDP-sugar pyrophosphorylase family protein
LQIIIPMSGFGERFRRAGYTVPKPLIEVEGKPIIAHVIDLFPGETDFTFICNQEHLDTPAYRMAEQIMHYCPTGRIAGIAPHKLGPVNAVLQAAGHLDPCAPTIVNYCDFACVWDYADFEQFVIQSGCDGAIPCYTGFHPHMMGSTSYAYVRQESGWVSDIQEKKPYTNQPMREFASSGTYYFKSGAMMLDCFARAMARTDLLLNGEFYVSLAYKPLLEDGRTVAVYELNHFMQWGTPADLAEYNYWSGAFRKLAVSRDEADPPRQAGAVMVSMAGLGARFAQAGYSEPKPVIEISGEPMTVQATRDLPRPEKLVFVQRRDLKGYARVSAMLRDRFPGCSLADVESVTEGQACTCLLAVDHVDAEKPLTIGACDNGATFSASSLAAMLSDEAVDVIVWVARGYPGAAHRPHHYGWVKEQQGRVLSVSVKQPLSDPARDPIVLGTFTFRRAGDFVRSANAMIARGGRVNGEFYVDNCINDAVEMGLDCRIFEIDHYLCWGTPDDLRTFEYWQSCFHKWDAHPYRLEGDAHVSAAAQVKLDECFRMRRPELSAV